ncbi:hypothetical protein MKK55_18770 [Methylobacterium sp. J-059]|uniref:hypothetical protein n=1 Tax=Methylobacterium sp. J-059 TaxID=2836643 RepID=UPI001FBBFD21|nr:hypothetical protein [Methylobacterium sp. J-059]MCJ2040974.1 hypothetical protein [Methylobacterium sp. J-059]
MPFSPNKAICVLGCVACLLGPAWPAAAQSTGYVTGFPGKDPAGDDEIGWGPAYRPETSFSQPGTPPTPGDFAGAAYRARTGRGPYDDVQNVGGIRQVRTEPGERFATASQRIVRARRIGKRSAAAHGHVRHRAARQAIR